MSTASFLRLICLAAIWGGSFLFMKIAANTFGPAYLIEFRVGFAAISLFLVSLYLRKKLAFRNHFKHFMIIGLFNTALPFLLFAYAAQTLNASTLSVLNSTAAIWGALIGVFWHKSLLTGKAVFGMLLGVSGVVVLVGWDAVNIGISAALPIAAGVMAACCYGIATNYTKTAPKVAAFENAHGNMWAAVLWILPLLPFVPMQGEPSTHEMLSVVALGVVCTGVAYLLYFRLVADEGAASALSVTFLIPVFGIMWGSLILDEPIGLNTFAGTILVLSGTMLVTGFSPAQLLKKSRVAEQVSG
ncbi:DMT family transporter [Vibrio coralliilyticus]|uniref:DMT family transporter n=1 Tax=Vibrio coralliilyticus TaxID=190893 RepID=UPI00148E3621|nr:DMT family transporter [Vibrio coralliilyticus]NOI27529.1 DMT family transporter [Vibrio coralliilyticus]NOI47351.1 DMT family transporter [Vibrio coralliilyticus]NUW69208.1 DMT family transporter [Vibrio coralliilyticus]